ALLLAGTGVSGILADRATNSRLGHALVVILLIIASLLLLVHKLWLVIIGQVLFLGSVTILQVILSRSLHQIAASHVRSGVSSLVTTIGTLLFIPLALFFGYISDRYGVFYAAWIVVAIVLVLGLSSIPVLYRQSVSN